MKKSPRPRFHAVTALAFKRWREELSEIIKAFREASIRLREGERSVVFPEGTFSPALPFVPFTVATIMQSRGQPS